MRTSLYPACSSSFFSCACFVDQVSPCDELWAKASWGKVKEITANTPACSRSRFSGWISGWRGGALDPLAVAARGGALDPLAVAADRRGDLFFIDRRWPGDAEAAAGRPRPRATTLGHAAVRAQELLRVNHFRYPHARARRQAPIPDRGFIF